MTKSIAIVMVLVMFFGLVGLCGEIEATYTLGNCEIVEINEDTAVAEDNRGNQWEFYIDANSELELGDEVSLVMDNNHTDYTRTDDEIKRVKIS